MDVVSYKRKGVHKVLSSLSFPRKSVVMSTDRFDMTMTVDWDFKPKTKEPQNGLHGSVIFMFNVVWSQIHLNTGAAVV